MRAPLALAFFAATLAAPVLAQTCGPTEILLKNDILPAVPSGPTRVGLVPGLCDGEAAMSVFTTQGAVNVKSVSIMLAQAQGTNGVSAVVDIEIYDGITDLGQGRWSLGRRVFRLSDGGSNAQIQTHGINQFTLPSPVRVASGKAVIGWRMLLNTSQGDCLSGYTSNFACDASGTCPRGINVLDAIGHGPVDPNAYTGFGLPLCPIFFQGSWIIRACVEPEVSVQWAGNPTPGGVVALTFVAPGHGGEQYLAMASNNIATGFQTPWGRLPLDPDWLFDCFFGPCRSAMFFNDVGILNPNGIGNGGLLIPNLPVLRNSNLRIYIGFTTALAPNLFPFTAISSPSQPIFIN